MSDYQDILRTATPKDIPAITDLILVHGPNEWNHLPEAEVRQHVGAIALCETFSVVAEIVGSLVGVTTYTVGHRYPEYQPEGRRDAKHGYVAEVVVRRDWAGQGLGPVLMTEAIQQLAADPEIGEVYAMRHADNIPSARMMEKAGMTPVAIIENDPIRSTGSRATVITQIVIEKPEVNQPSTAPPSLKFHSGLSLNNGQD